MESSFIHPSTHSGVSYCNNISQNNSYPPQHDQNPITNFQQTPHQSRQYGPGIGMGYHQELGFGIKPQFNYQGVWPDLQAARMMPVTAGTEYGDVARGVAQPSQHASSQTRRADAPVRTPATMEMMLAHASVIIQNANAPVEAVYAQMYQTSPPYPPTPQYSPPLGPPPQYLMAQYPHASPLRAVPTFPPGLVPYQHNPYMQPISPSRMNYYHPLPPHSSSGVRTEPLHHAATDPGHYMTTTQTNNGPRAFWDGPRGQWMEATAKSMESPTSSISSISTWSQPPTPLEHPWNNLPTSSVMSPCMAQITDSMKDIAVGSESSHPESESSVNNEELEYLPDGVGDASNATVVHSPTDIDGADSQVEGDQAEILPPAETNRDEDRMDDVDASANSPNPTSPLPSPPINPAGVSATQPSDAMDPEDTGELDEAPAKPKRPKTRTVVDWSDRAKHYEQPRGRGRPPVPPEGSHGQYAKASCVACKRDYLHKKGLQYHINTEKRPHCSVWCAEQIEPPPGIDANPKISRKRKVEEKDSQKKAKSSKKEKDSQKKAQSSRKKKSASNGERRRVKTRKKSSVPAPSEFVN